MTRFSETQIIRLFREHDAGKETKDICRENGVSLTTFYNWKKTVMKIIHMDPLGESLQGSI